MVRSARRSSLRPVARRRSAPAADRRRGAAPRRPPRRSRPAETACSPSAARNGGGRAGGARGTAARSGGRVGRREKGAGGAGPVVHVELLLEVVAEWEVEKRAPVGGEFHRGGQTALDHRQVAGRQVAFQIGHVAT